MINDIYSQLVSMAKGQNQDIEIAESTRSSQADFMPEFITKTRDVRELMQAIKATNESIDELKEQQKKASTAEEEKKIDKRIQRGLKKNLERTELIKLQMKDIDEEISICKQTQKDEPETRSKIFMQRALRAEMGRLMQETQVVHTQYKSVMRDKISRQIDMIDKDLTQDQKEELIGDPDALQKLIVKRTFGEVSYKMKSQASDIIEKAQEINKLEKSYEECLKLMNDIAFMVQEQGEQLDNIELNLQAAVNYTEKAATHLEDEQKQHKKSRRKLWCIILIALMIVGVMVAPILIKLNNKSKTTSKTTTSLI